MKKLFIAMTLAAAITLTVFGLQASNVKENGNCCQTECCCKGDAAQENCCATDIEAVGESACCNPV